MKAAVVEQFKEPLKIKEVEKPTISYGEVLVRIKACGVCHTDLHAAHGDWPVKPKLPLIPGHEGVGIVEEVGLGVTHLKVGDRVGIPWLYSACGHCEYCLSGHVSTKKTLATQSTEVMLNTAERRQTMWSKFLTTYHLKKPLQFSAPESLLIRL